MSTKAVKALDAEIRRLRRQITLVQKQRDAEALKAVDLTKKFKVGQLLNIRRYNGHNSLQVYKVLAVHQDYLVTKMMYVTARELTVYPKKYKLPWYTAQEAVIVNRKALAEMLDNLNKLVNSARQDFLD